MATSKTTPMLCIEGYQDQVTTGRIYEVERDHPGIYHVVTAANDGERGGYRKDRFRPLTRQEEEDYIQSRVERMLPVDGTPGHPPVNFPIPSTPRTITELAETCSGYDLAPASQTAVPDGNPKTRFGMAKPPLALIPGPALIHMADAFRDGAGKYGPANWREDPVTTSTYVNAALRHILAYYDGERTAEDSGVHHLGHAAGCLAILLDAEEQGTLNDDRPKAGRTSALIKEQTRPLT